MFVTFNEYEYICTVIDGIPSDPADYVPPEDILSMRIVPDIGKNPGWLWFLMWIEQRGTVTDENRGTVMKIRNIINDSLVIGD